MIYRSCNFHFLKRLLPFWFLAVIALGSAVSLRAEGQKFEPGCPLPFQDIAKSHPIDDTCIAEGNGSKEAQKAQNQAKNDFCATGTPSEVTFVSFGKLQAAAKKAGVTFGSDAQLPDDRSKLHDLYKTSSGDTIGEGSLVRLVAFVVDAHYSNAKKPSAGRKPGESVNCNHIGEEFNDIHIMLGPTTKTTPCKTVTAEMSPHERPDAWTADALNAVDGPVRITGHLFFDASHTPCTPGHPASPARLSLWEIHPVYQVEVCTNATIADCDVNDDTLWTPFDKAGTP